MEKSEFHQTYWNMYALMRQEMAHINQDIRRIQSFTMVGVGAAYSYLFTNASSASPVSVMFWFVVPLLVLVAWLPSFNLVKLRRTKARYLCEEIESRMFDSLGVPGWETYLNDHLPRMPHFMHVYWPALFVLTLGIALSRLL